MRSGSTAALPTDRTFTGQKQDGTGLLYYNARYYDSALGVFLSPDTLVPDAGRVVDYNRFLYVRGNPLKYNDPSGHCIFGIDTVFCVIAAVAALNVAVDYVVTTQVFKEEYTVADGLITAVTSGLTGGASVGIASFTKAAIKGGVKRIFLSGAMNASSTMILNTVNRGAKDFVHGRIVGSSTGGEELAVDAAAGFFAGSVGPALDHFVIQGMFDESTYFLNRGEYWHIFDHDPGVKYVIEGKLYTFTSMFGTMATDSAIFSGFFQWFQTQFGREPTEEEMYQYGILREDGD